jgi:hypothetical protein
VRVEDIPCFPRPFFVFRGVLVQPKEDIKVVGESFLGINGRTTLLELPALPNHMEFVRVSSDQALKARYEESE